MKVVISWNFVISKCIPYEKPSYPAGVCKMLNVILDYTITKSEPIYGNWILEYKSIFKLNCSLVTYIMIELERFSYTEIKRTAYTKTSLHSFHDALTDFNKI